MPHFARPLLVLALLGIVAPGASAGPRKVPAQIARARYVCLGYYTGDGFLSAQQAIRSPESVAPDDRRALDAIRDELADWGRYVLTPDPKNAELLIAVRTARRAVASIGIGTDTGGGRGRSGVGAAEISSPDDVLAVYESRGGQPGTELWRVQRRGALSGTPPRAFAELRADVELTPAPPSRTP